MGQEDQQHEGTAGARKEVKAQVTLVAVNENGFRIGATHHNATIPEETVQRIRYLHEEEGIGYRRLARMFNLRRDTVVKICRYERRGQVPRSWKRVKEASRKTA